MPALASLIFVFLESLTLLASPAQETLVPNNRPYDVQAHRGGRGSTVESILPTFAWGLIEGTTTLELDNGITSDGEVVVWHDTQITADKCTDTRPVFPDDPMFPYVGKYIVNLTLAQIRTVDCGSKRQPDFPYQLLYPGARIPTLQEVFNFVECADPSHRMLWDIESKIEPEYPERTASVEDFVQKQHAIFSASPYYRSITFRLENFDRYEGDDFSSRIDGGHRMMEFKQEFDPLIRISAPIYDETAFNSSNLWLGGVDIEGFPGPSPGEKIAQAARSIGANELSPCGDCSIPSRVIWEGDRNFTSLAMVREAHALGMSVKVWNLNDLVLSQMEELTRLGIDGVITDYPSIVRRWAKQQGFAVAPKYPKQRVFSCLEKHLQISR